MRTAPALAACVLGLVLAGLASAQTPLPAVDHTSVSAYDSLTPEQVIDLTSQRILIVDRSVGGILAANDNVCALCCLSVPYASARASCRRYLHPIAQYSSPPETWSVIVNRSHVTFFGWPGSGITPELPCGQEANQWIQKVDCFLAYAEAHAGDYDAVVLLPSYLDAPEAASYITAMLDYRAAHPGVRVILATSSLSRDRIAGLTGFNAAIRGAARDHGFPLWDVADIESYDPFGVQWMDGRDGIDFHVPGGCSETWPDDGISEPAIAPHYTRECQGGHPGNPDTGKIRIGKAFWVLVSQMLVPDAPSPWDTTVPGITISCPPFTLPALTSFDCMIHFEDDTGVTGLSFSATAHDASGNVSAIGQVDLP